MGALETKMVTTAPFLFLKKVGLTRRAPCGTKQSYVKGIIQLLRKPDYGPLSVPVGFALSVVRACSLP